MNVDFLGNSGNPQKSFFKTLDKFSQAPHNSILC